ncbi:hypothetical protein F4678DRAFT_467666 [Xylaria arbuscula]|nr:hypothetical protein F4678DRAFT_467666 [Xylaria arbuscula]
MSISVHPTLSDHAEAGMPLWVPWMRQEIAMGTGMNSALLKTENPWVSLSPFEFGTKEAKWIVYDGKTDGKSTFRETESDSHSSTVDHYSGSLGVTVGCPFLKANVTGSYDKTVNTTTNSHKMSRSSFCHDGTVKFLRDPPLSYSARHLLTEAQGEELFRHKYGDYYVAGFTLGGEAGAFISVDSGSRDEVNTTSITVSVKNISSTPLVDTTLWEVSKTSINQIADPWRKFKPHVKVI